MVYYIGRRSGNKHVGQGSGNDTINIDLAVICGTKISWGSKRGGDEKMYL